MLSLVKKNRNDIFGSFDETMRDLFGDHLFRDTIASRGLSHSRYTSASERRTDDLYELWIDIPGAKKENVTLTISNGTLRVSAIRADIKDVAYERSVVIGDSYDEDTAAAKLIDGVLYVTMKVRANKDPTEKKIEIE